MTNLSAMDRRAFFRVTALSAGSLAVTTSLSAANPLTAVPRSRLDRLATGANVCQWSRFPRGNSAEHFTNYISAAEAAFMARLGLKHVRLCVAPRVIMDRTSGQVIQQRGKQLDAAIERFHRAGLLVMVDIHNEDRAAELNPAWQEAFVRFWGSLAARLSRFDPEWTMLEIINEPVFDRCEEERTMQHAQTNLDFDRSGQRRLPRPNRADAHERERDGGRILRGQANVAGRTPRRG
ncbi:MAG: cellulase family glycosylhydrolase [Thermoguttaceae bacterium]